jgi:hypothetical protein
VSLAYAMTVGHYFARDTLNRDHFVEFSFWGLNGWKDRAQINGDRVSNTSFDPAFPLVVHGSLYSKFFLGDQGTPLPGFDGVDQQTTYYASYNQNFEINGRISPRNREDRLVLHPNGRWRRECQPGMYMSYLYGVRFMQVDETFRFHGQGLTETLDPATGNVVSAISQTGDYGVVTHNNLLGLQIGADMIFRECRWSWGVRAKVGPYINFSDQESNITAGTALAPEFSRRLAEAKHEASLIGQVGFEATYKFRPNLMGRAGWDFMWVTGLALAPEQLQFTTNPVNKINTNGSIFYQGLSLGLEWLW